MSRQRISGTFPFFLFLPLFLLNITSCGSAQILGLSRREAADLLRKGDYSFIRRSELPSDFSPAVSRLKQLEGVDPAAAFYAGLFIAANGNEAIAETAPGSAEENKNSYSAHELSILLFCAVLDSPSLPAGKEAAGKLIPLILESGEEREARNTLGYLDSVNMKGKPDAHMVTLRAACLYSLGRFDETLKILSANSAAAESAAENSVAIDTVDEWNRCLAFFSARKATPAADNENFRKDITAFLLKNLPAEIRSWAFNEVFASEQILSAEETTAISNRLSVLPYHTYLNSMRQALLDGGSIFFRHPDLIADLGRAYQYTPARREEGARLFKAWAALLENPESAPEDGDYRALGNYIKTLDSEALRERRFLILFYLGRIERAGEDFTSSSDSFKRALDFAPNELQSDACIWYMLMNTFNREPSAALSLALSTMPRWNDVSYFADILDRLSCYLSARRRWTSLLEIFDGLERKNAGGAAHAGASLAQFAWILGRAEQEGYINTGRGAKSLFRIAFEEGKDAFYYRAMAASKLGETFAPEPSAEPRPDRGSPPEKDNQGKEKEPYKERKDETDFILGFFEYGAASLALPYIQEREELLSVPELRKIAEALSSSGYWKESLNLVSRYTGRVDYKISRQDLLLFYPRPFRELMEKNAKEMELGPEILYGLIRTESYFQSEIVSRAGAIGLAQLMEPTALEMAGRIARRGGNDYRGPDGIDLKDPGISIHIGSFYLRYLTEQMGNPMLALLAYNGGMGRVRRWLNTDRQQKGGGLPQDIFLETIEITETREYGRRVLAAAAVYGYLYYGMTMESVAADMYR